MKIWFASDFHFGHKNIISYSKRPFLIDPSKGYIDGNLDVAQMDETLIKNWNSVVSAEDTTYIIGDFSFHKDPKKTINIIRRLNGNKILIRGNHDEGLTAEVLQCFGGVHYYFELSVKDPDVGKQKIVLFHYSMKVWSGSHRGAWSLYGHSHGSLPDDPNSLSIDVGVDCHNYIPISYEQVKKVMSKKKYKPVDHHGG